jgi:hypothetical protein
MTVSLIQEEWETCGQSLLFCERCDESEVSELITGDMTGKLRDMYEVRHSDHPYYWETVCERCVDEALKEDTQP